MNEKRIQEIMTIERQAQEVLEAAQQEAEAVPLRAEQEGRDLIEKARRTAREEARQLLDAAGAGDISPKAERPVGEMERLAAKNLDAAIQYVLERVIGKQ